jgi:hypothetical protein
MTTEEKLALYAEIRKLLNKPHLVVRLNGDSIEIYDQPINCPTHWVQWCSVGTYKDGVISVNVINKG